MNTKRLVKVGLIQSKVSSDINLNLEKTEKMIRQAAKSGAQIICLQELFQTPYFPQKQKMKKDDFAESITGPTVSLMKSLSKELGVVIVVPFYEKRGSKYYNTAAVVSDSGKLIGQYDKVHIPQDPGFYEKDYFEHGENGYKIFKTKFGTFAVLICFDQWFPEAAREARLAGAQMIFYPTAIGNITGYVPPEGDWHNAWETVMRGHAIANSVVVAAVNRTGKEDQTSFWGQSFVSDAFGKVLKRASSNKEEVVVVEVDLAMNEFISEGWGFMRNRRPDTYGNIVSNKLTKKSKKLQNVAHYKDTQKALGEK
ncbi:MAG: carbon-nitrogen hydrolase [bacterium]